MRYATAAEAATVEIMGPTPFHSFALEGTKPFL